MIAEIQWYRGPYSGGSEGTVNLDHSRVSAATALLAINPSDDVTTAMVLLGRTFNCTLCGARLVFTFHRLWIRGKKLSAPAQTPAPASDTVKGNKSFVKMMCFFVQFHPCLIGRTKILYIPYNF